MANLTIGSNYEYALGSTYKARPDFQDFLTNLFNMEVFTNGAFFKGQTEGLGDEIISIAKEYVVAQDIPGPDLSFTGTSKEHTKNLLNSFHQETSQTSVNVYNDAQNASGQLYAGHVEFGSHPFGQSKYMPPRPYLRPALRTAAVLSRGALPKAAVDTLFSSEIVRQHFGRSYRGSQSLSFGSKSISGLAGREVRHYIRENFADSKKYTKFQKGFGAVRPSKTDSSARDQKYNTKYVRRTMGWKQDRHV